MATPSKKNPEIENILETLFGRTSAITTDVCVSCDEPATEFEDERSRKEYSISGLCQKCQNEIFG
jgi:hypothetical protein